MWGLDTDWENVWPPLPSGLVEIFIITFHAIYSFWKSVWFWTFLKGGSQRFSAVSKVQSGFNYFLSRGKISRGNKIYTFKMYIYTYYSLRETFTKYCNFESFTSAPNIMAAMCHSCQHHQRKELFPTHVTCMPSHPCYPFYCYLSEIKTKSHEPIITSPTSWSFSCATALAVQANRQALSHTPRPISPSGSLHGVGLRTAWPVWKHQRLNPQWITSSLGLHAHWMHTHFWHTKRNLLLKICILSHHIYPHLFKGVFLIRLKHGSSFKCDLVIRTSYRSPIWWCKHGLNFKVRVLVSQLTSQRVIQRITAACRCSLVSATARNCLHAGDTNLL